MTTHTIYVAGFLFGPMPRHNYVALIRKNKPDWQKGKLNGIGGKVEAGETPRRGQSSETHLYHVRRLWCYRLQECARVICCGTGAGPIGQWLRRGLQTPRRLL